jgi:tubulin polyglutamylase TTLL6/13
MHLTNYAINKSSENFIREDNNNGSKRSIKSVLLELERDRGINKEIVWERICDAVVKTIITVQPQLSR